MINFNKPTITQLEEKYIVDALHNSILSGDGKYTNRVYQQFQERFGIKNMLLTTSGTTALEMASILADLQDGDEVLDYCVQKLPSNDDFKFNEHNDNCVKKAVLSSTEKQNFTKIAQELNKLGLYMAGLDVIDGKIIEVNITSPCYFIREINNAFGIHLERTIVDYILSKVPAPSAANV